MIGQSIKPPKEGRMRDEYPKGVISSEKKNLESTC
jgi:hypothetical protein